MSGSMKCWEFKKCGREPGGAKVAEFGACPVPELGAGAVCWLVAGTFCGGEVQGTSAQKLYNCMRCDFYQRFSLEERAYARRDFERSRGG